MREGGREGRTDEQRRQGVTGHFQISCELWAAARGGGRTTRQKKGRGEGEGREGRTDGRTAEAGRYGALSNQL